MNSEEKDYSILIPAFLSNRLNNAERKEMEEAISENQSLRKQVDLQKRLKKEITELQEDDFAKEALLMSLQVGQNVAKEHKKRTVQRRNIKVYAAAAAFLLVAYFIFQAVSPFKNQYIEEPFAMIPYDHENIINVTGDLPLEKALSYYSQSRFEEAEVHFDQVYLDLTGIVFLKATNDYYTSKFNEAERLLKELSGQPNAPEKPVDFYLDLIQIQYQPNKGAEILSKWIDIQRDDISPIALNALEKWEKRMTD